MKAPLPAPVLHHPTTDEPTDWCVPSAQSVPDPAASRDLASRLKALSDPTRLQLLQLVAAHPDGRACICDLTEPVGVSQPTVSHHMRLLADAGLVTREQRGRWAYYTVQPGALADLGQRVTQIGLPSIRTDGGTRSRHTLGTA